MKYSLFVLLLIIYINFIFASWLPIKNYTSKNYGSQYSNYTYSVVIDQNGLLLVGSVYGVLQFDGYRWKFIAIKSGAYVTSLVYCNGLIYVGCTNDFGYLFINNKSEYQYISLANKHNIVLNAPIFSINVINNAVYFQSEDVIYEFKNHKINILKSSTTFHLAFTVDNQLVVRVRKKGLYRIVNQNFEFIEHSECFSDIGIFAILPYKKNSKLIITQESNFFEWKNNTFVPLLPKPVNEFFNNATIVGAKLLSDNNIALFTLNKGLFVVDTTWKIISKYTTANGLLSDEIHDVVEDYFGNLWLATQKGISHVQYASAFSFFNEKSGLNGNVLVVKKFNHQYWVGTTEGLFVFQQTSDFVNEISSVKGKIWSIDTNHHYIVIAGDNGLWKVDRYNNIQKINNDHFSAVVYLHNLKHWFVAGNKGSILYSSELTKADKRLMDLKIDAFGIVASLIHDSYEIWLGSYNNGVYQIFIDKKQQVHTTHYKGLEDGLPEDWVCPYLYQDKVLYATSNGFLQFISPEQINQITGNQSTENIKGFFDVINFPSNIQNKSITAFCFNNNRTFISIENSIYVNERAQTKAELFIQGLNSGRINFITCDENNLWIASDDALILTNLIKLQNRKSLKPFFTATHIILNDDSMLFYTNQSKLNLPFHYNSLKIQLASLYADNDNQLKYQYILKTTNDSTIRSWDSEPQILLHKLNEGNYTLIIQAKDIYENVSLPLSIQFNILPPWYRTWWAYLLYIVLAMAFIYMVVYFNSRRLIAKNLRLETIIKQRTQEIILQKEQIEQQKITIENILHDLNDSIEYAQRIQQALLPSINLLNEHFHDYFVLYKPRDVVSGDFYWAAKVKETIVIAVADCTGHGVPGALMSMLGIAFLNDIVSKKKILKPAEIVEHLRRYIIEALKQSTNSDSQKDGMDISLLALNIQTKECQWTGANNSLYIITDKHEVVHFAKIKNIQVIENHSERVLIELKPDNMPVAIHPIMNEFTNHSFQVINGTCFYLFSDGYADQFGGPKGKKFMYKAFKQLLLQHADKSMMEQNQILDNTINDWMKNEKQNDDITVLGVRI